VEKVKSYGAHALTYALSVLTIVAGTSPQSIPASWLPWIGAASLALGGAHNAWAAGAPKPGAITTAVKSFAVLAITAALVTLVGCASWTPQQRLGAQIVVKKATGEYIKRAADPADRAARVARAVAAIEAHVGDEAVTLDLLQGVAMSYVAQVQDPLDRDLLGDVVLAAVAELQEYAHGGVLNETDKLAVSRVLAWVKDTASLYVPDTP